MPSQFHRHAGRVRVNREGASARDTGRVRTVNPLDAGSSATVTGRLALEVSAESARLALHTGEDFDPVSIRTTFLVTLDHARYRLRMPIPVEIAQGRDATTASAHDLETYGAGSDEYGALDELRRALVEDFEMLIEIEADLGPAPARQLARMRQVLEVVR